jgi:hypothetical protein
MPAMLRVGLAVLRAEQLLKPTRWLAASGARRVQCAQDPDGGTPELGDPTAASEAGSQFHRNAWAYALLFRPGVGLR